MHEGFPFVRLQTTRYSKVHRTFSLDARAPGSSTSIAKNDLLPLYLVEMAVVSSQIVDLGFPGMRPAPLLSSPIGSPISGLGLQRERPPASLSLAGCVLGFPFGRLRTTRYSKVHRTFSLTLVPRGVRLSPHNFIGDIKKQGPCEPCFLCLVEMARVELASESISAGISPSAVIVLVVSPLPAPNDRLRNQLSRCSSTLPGTRAEFSCIVDARHRAYR